MRKGFRAVIVATAAAALLLTGCTATNAPPTKNSDLSSLPPQQGSPKQGGNVTVGLGPGLGPTWMLPYQPSQYANYDTFTGFHILMWRPLLWSFEGTTPVVDYQESIGKKPSYSADGKTVTIDLNDNYTWSDGKPVVAEDVVFAISLLKAAVASSPANYWLYTPGLFPDVVTGATATGEHQVQITLSERVNPSWFTENILTQIVPLPSASWNKTASAENLNYTDPATAARIYDYLAEQSKDVASYEKNPLWQIVDGPFHLKSYDPSSTDAVLARNDKYTGPGKPHIDTYTLKSFTSPAALQNALQSKDIDIASIPPANAQNATGLTKIGYHSFMEPTLAYFPIFYNFKNTTGSFNAIIGQRYIREAFAHLQDQQGVIKGVFKGFAAPSYGTVPATTDSKYLPKDGRENPYPFSIDTAKSILTSHGWKVAEGGVTTCARPGDGDDECGKGIAAGTKLAWNLYYNSGTPTTALQAQALASNAKRVGINIELIGKDAGYLIKNISNVSSPSTTNDWGMLFLGGRTVFMYPSSLVNLSSTGVSNTGSYNSAKADALMHESIFGSDPNAVRNEVEFLTQDQPVLFTPTRATVIVWSTQLSGPPDSFGSFAMNVAMPQYWYFVK